MSDYETFHATIREGEYMTKIELLFANATKLIVFQDVFDAEFTDCVVFESYRGERSVFRATCVLELDDRRLSDLQLLTSRWFVHHHYLVQREKFASQSYELRRKCNFRS
jgi:hypothetical protein